MKRFLILLAAVLLVAGCGVGAYSYYDYDYPSYPSGSHSHRHHTPSHSSMGRNEATGVMFFADRAKNIDVVIDFKAYRVKTVKYNSRTRRNFERAIDNTIPVRPGLHNIQVIRNGRIIYDQRLYIYPNGVQSIYL